MADVELYGDDGDDNLDIGDDGGSSLGLDDYDLDPDAGLNPLQKLQKCAESKNMYTRQMGARSLLETLRLTETSEHDDDPTEVLRVMSAMAEDPEGTVRTELMEQVPHIAMYCHENAVSFDNPTRDFILPIVVKYLTDCNNQVRKTSQAALLVLLEQDLITKEDVEEQVCPVILELALDDSQDDCRSEAVALMSKLAPLVGPEITVRLFLPRFAEMCTDTLFHVRKVCAANFGDMCTVVGPQNTEKYLLPKFYYLCEDGVWGVRKACAECFMQVSYACTPETRRTELAQLFTSLVADQSRWVRMSAFQALGGFISTFADPCVTGLYVTEDGTLVAANQESEPDSDGDKSGDITTEVPSQTALCDKDSSSGNDSHQTLTQPSDHSSSENSQVVPMDIVYNEEEDVTVSSHVAGLSLEEQRAQHCQESMQSSSSHKAESALSSSDASTSDKNPSSSTPSDSKNSHPTKPPDLPLTDFSTTEDVKSPEYSSFLFWREPLPDIGENDLDIKEAKNSDDKLSEPNVISNSSDNSQENKTSTDNTVLEKHASDDMSSQNPQVYTADVLSEAAGEEEVVTNIGSEHVLGQSVGEGTHTIVNGVVRDVSGHSSLGYSPVEDNRHVEGDSTSSSPVFSTSDQDVIPRALLDHYLSMIDPSRAQTVDAEIAKHCAHSLPAVAYTLGRKHWPCLKDLYDTLAADMQWKVRRTLAFSIHELALIVGEDITGRDLVPVFNGFLNDLDEVRIGVLKHLSDFLKFLRPHLRQEYLTKLVEFLKMDNNRNWRFREELAEQLVSLLDLFSPEDSSKHVTPIAMVLATDKVATVRQTAFRALSGIVHHVREDEVLLGQLLDEIKQKFAHHNRWSHRHMFAQFCLAVLEDRSLSSEEFARELLPTLLHLQNDRIPNVRIALARVISLYLHSSEYYTSPQNPHQVALLEATQTLQRDKDRDVRFFIFMHAACRTTLLTQDDTIPV